MKRLLSLQNNNFNFLWAPAIFMAGFFFVIFPLLGNDLSYIPGDIGDARLNMYFLEHGFRFLKGLETSFWNAPFFYPAENVMAYSDNLLGVLPFYAIFRFMGIDIYSSFQFWTIVLFFLNFSSCYLILRKFKYSSAGSAIGAYIFTFSLPMIAQIGHIQLMARMAVPPAFYYLERFIDKGNYKNLMISGIFWVYQMYCSIYMGLFLAIGLFFWLITGIYLRTSSWKKTFHELISVFFHRNVLFISVLIILCLVPLAIPYLEAAQQFGMRSWSDVYSMLPRLRSYFYPDQGSLLWQGLRKMGETLPLCWEHKIFPGIIPMGAFLFSLFVFFRRKKGEILQDPVPFTATLTCASIVILTLALGKEISLYYLLYRIPGFGSLRAITRIILLLMFPLSILVAYFWDKLFSIFRSKGKYIGIFLLMTMLPLVILDQFIHPDHFYHFPKKEAKKRVEKITEQFNGIITEGKPILAYLPVNGKDPYFAIHLDAMLAAQKMNMNVINGYSGNFPPGYPFIFDFDPQELDKWFFVNDPEASENILVVGRGKPFFYQLEQDHRKWTFSRGPLEENGFSSFISVPKEVIHTSNDRYFQIKPQITNSSQVLWPSLSKTGEFMINLSYRWLDRNMKTLTGFENRYPLPHDIASGKSANINISIRAPQKSGTYYLELDLVQELVAWFRDKGNETALMKVIVTK